MLLTTVEVGDDIGVGVSRGVTGFVVGVLCPVGGFVAPAQEANNHSRRRTPLLRLFCFLLAAVRCSSPKNCRWYMLPFYFSRELGASTRGLVCLVGPAVSVS